MFYCTRYRSRWNCYIERTSSVRLIFDIRSLTFERVYNERHSFFKIKIQQIIMGWLIFFANSNSSEFSYFHKSNSWSIFLQDKRKEGDAIDLCVNPGRSFANDLIPTRHLYFNIIRLYFYLWILSFFLFLFFLFFFFFFEISLYSFFSFFFILHLIVNAQLARDQRFL